MAGPYDYSAPLGQAEGLPQPQEGASILNGINQGLQLRYGMAQNQIALQKQQMALQAQQAAASDPSPENLLKLGAAMPEYGAQMSQLHDAKNTDQQNADLQSSLAVYGLGLNGKYDDAAAQVKQRIDAGQKGLQPLYDMFNSGDQAQQKQGTALAGMYLLGAGGAARFHDITGAKIDLDKEPSAIALTTAQANQANAEAAKARVLPLSNADGSQTPYVIGGDGSGQPATGQGAPAAPGAQVSAPAAQPGQQTRGVRNNNPVNVSNLASGKWAGQTGSDGQYAVFSTPQAGWAAADKNLQSYAEHHGINTVAGIVSRWAPQSGGNDTAAYINTVSQDLGVDPNKPINLSDPNVRQAVLQSMSNVELGKGAQAAQPGGQPQAQPAPSGASPSGVTVSPAPGFQPGRGAEISPQAIEQYAQQYVADGTMPDLGRGNLSAIQKAQIITRAAQIESANGQTGYDVAARRAAAASNEKALDSVTLQANAMHTAEQTVLKNMQLVTDLAKKGAGKAGSPWLNAPIQSLRKNGWGNDDVAAFDEAIGATADEFATYIGKGTPSVSGREDAKERLDRAATPQQLLAIMTQMQKQMANQAGSYDAQRDALIGSIRTGITATGHALPQLKSPQEMKKLPTGTAFLTPDGRMMVTP